MVDAPDNFERVESAANIYVRMSVGDEAFEIPVSEIDFTKDVDVERVREMGLYPDGYAINAVDIDGSLSFAGYEVRLPSGGTRNLDQLLFDDDGSPVVFNITVAHEDPTDADAKADTETIANCIVTQSEYSASSGDTTESAYDFMAQRINN